MDGPCAVFSFNQFFEATFVGLIQNKGVGHLKYGNKEKKSSQTSIIITVFTQSSSCHLTKKIQADCRQEIFINLPK